MANSCTWHVDVRHQTTYYNRTLSVKSNNVIGKKNQIYMILNGFDGNNNKQLTKHTRAHRTYKHSVGMRYTSSIEQPHTHTHKRTSQANVSSLFCTLTSPCNLNGRKVPKHFKRTKTIHWTAARVANTIARCQCMGEKVMWLCESVSEWLNACLHMYECVCVCSVCANIRNGAVLMYVSILLSMYACKQKSTTTLQYIHRKKLMYWAMYIWTYVVSFIPIASRC